MFLFFLDITLVNNLSEYLSRVSHTWLQIFSNHIKKEQSSYSLCNNTHNSGRGNIVFGNSNASLWRTTRVMRTRPYSRNLQGKGARTHIRAFTYAQTTSIMTLTDAKPRLLKFLSIGGDRWGEQCPPPSFFALLKAIFLTLAIIEDPNWKCVTANMDVLHKLARLIEYMYIHARVNMDGGSIIFVCPPSPVSCPRHCYITEKCNKSCTIIMIAYIRWNWVFIVGALPWKFQRINRSSIDRFYYERIDLKFISLISPTRFAFREHALKFMRLLRQILLLEVWFKNEN